MPTYSVTSPSGQTIDVSAPNQDLANQFVAQRFFSGLEQPPNAASNSPTTSGAHFYQQPSLAQQLAAKRTGDPAAVPTTADIMQAANLRTNAEAEASSSAEMQRDALRQHQREQARLNSVWEDDEPPSEPLPTEPDQSAPPVPQQQQWTQQQQQMRRAPWSERHLRDARSTQSRSASASNAQWWMSPALRASLLRRLSRR